MLQGKLGEVKHNKQEKGELAVRESIAVVPLALPLMAGPGAISSVIVYASQSHWQQLLGMSVVVVVFSFCSGSSSAPPRCCSRSWATPVSTW